MGELLIIYWMEVNEAKRPTGCGGGGGGGGSRWRADDFLLIDLFRSTSASCNLCRPELFE